MRAMLFSTVVLQKNHPALFVSQIAKSSDAFTDDLDNSPDVLA